MNKWGRWYLPLCIFTIINYLVWRKSVQVNKAGPIGGEDDDCVKDPSCGADCQVCCQLPYNKDTGKLVVHHYFTGWGLWTRGLTLSTWSSVRNGEENSGWNSILPPDVQTDGEVLQDQGLQLGEDGLEDFLLEFFFSELIVVISAYFEFMSNLSNSLKTKTRSETSSCECAFASRESSELYWHMRMLKCDMSDWLSDEPPKMLKLLFATKNLRRTIFRLWMRLSMRWASTRTLRDLVVQ